MSQQEKTIKWGDIIRIHGVSTNRDKQAKGLIISKGFTDPNVYYQTFLNYDEVNFYRESLFQILPKSNFDLHDQLLNDENLKDQQKDALRERAKEQIVNLENALLNKYNDVEHPDEIYVTYGSEVVFKHIESGQFLSGVLKAADIGQGAFKLELVKELSSFLYFRIVSHRSYEELGNKIYYDDCLRIHHSRSDCYMNFPDTQTSIIFDRPYEVAQFEKNDAGYQYAQNRPSIKKPINRRINVINENKSKCLWKFILHCRFEDSKKKEKIKSHDIVYFQHTKNKGLIASTLANQKYYLKQLKDTNQQSVSYECFWQLIPKEGNQFGPETCNLFWARNIVTGQILKYQDFNVQIQSKEQIQDGGFKSQGLVNLICAIGSDQKGNQIKYLLERGQNIPSDDNVDLVVKYFDQNIRKVDFKKVQQLSEDSFIIVRVSEQTIHDVSYVLSSQEAFVKVVEIISTELKKKQSDQNITWKDMFLNLNQDLLVSFISVLKLLIGKIYGTDFKEIQSSGNSPILQVQKILVQTGIAQLIIELIFTLYEPFQQILSNKDFTEDRAIRLKIAEIFELSYILVEKIVKEFLQNKIYFSRWIKLFLLQSNTINKPFIQQCLVSILQNNPVSIRAMIRNEIIDELINYFFEEASNNGDGDLTTNHLRLFSTFIKGDDVIFKENQKKILNDFFMSEHNQWTFKFKVEYRISEAQDNSDDFREKQRNKVVKVSFGGEDPCTLPQFFERYSNKFNYLMSYINLLADVCMDRNNQAYDYVEGNVPLAVVSTVLFDHDIKTLNQTLKQANQASGQLKRFPNTNIHQPFIRIAHHAYVNNFNFSPIRRIRKIVKWYRFDQQKEFNDVEDITKTKRVYEGQKEQQQKTYLKYLLAYIKSFLQNYDKDTCNLINNLQLLYTILNFLKETIILGLWESIDEFRQIIPLLIKNITKIEGNIFFEKYDENAQNRYNGKEWVDLNKQKLRMNRPEIALQIECKIKATEIFKYMNEMEIDIRLRYMMNFFQGIYEATQNFQNYSQSIEDELQVDDKLQNKDDIIKRNQQAKEEFYKIFGSNILGQIKKVSQDQDLMLKEYIWFNKIKTMIPLFYEKTQEPDKDRDLFKHTPEDYPLENIVLSLFELSGYLNRSLLNNSLKMLRAMFQQRSDLIKSFKDLLICGKGNLNEVYSNLKFMRNKFAMLKNDTIIRYDGIQNKSFAYAIFKPYDHLGRQQDKRSGIIQDLFFLARTLKDNVSLKNIQSLMFVEKDVFDKSIVYHFYNQKEKNNSLFQQLNMAEGIYDPLLEYIKIIGRGRQELPQIHRWLLFSIYQYLTLLCFNNMKAKHIFMEYIPFIIPHLNKRVGAASFLYQVCINNKILVNNQNRVEQIIQGALNSCVQLQQEELIHGIVSNAINQDLKLNNNFEKSRILYCLRGVLIFNDQGHKRNQQILMNRLQDNKFRRLVYNGFLRYTAKKQQFNLSPAETYATTHFELFSVLVESQNLINIGKLQNLHPYIYCLQRLSETNRWQIRRALRSYVNRLYYVHKDRDIFLFEQFIRRQFTIINGQLSDLIELHKSKMLTQDLKVKNGIRFVFAQSEIILLIIQILITLHEIFLKPLFLKLLKRELGKQQKQDDGSKKLHSSLIKLLKHLGCIEKLYHNTKTIVSFVRQIKKLMEEVLIRFHVRYLEKMAAPEEVGSSKQQQKKQKEPELSKKTYTFDHSRTFFRNLAEMIRFQKQQENHQRLKQEYMKKKNQMDVSQNDLKKKYIDAIFAVPSQNLRPINSVRIRQQQQLHYKPHLQTANSKIFKLLAKPQLEENEENLELNTRLNNVKELLTDSPAFKKLKQDQFYKLVKIFTSMDSVASSIYTQNWKSVQQEPRAVFSQKQIIKNCFSLIIHNPNQVTDAEKIFIIKLVRCYISEAVESEQNHKLSVDKWNADYYTDEYSGANSSAEDRSELVRRQHEIEQCGGSRLLLSIFRENLFGKTELLNQTLLLGIIYLFNGNTHCQNSLLAELVADPQNITFMSLKQLIKNIGTFLVQVRKFKENQKKRAFSYKIVDSYDHFDSKENILVKLFGHKTDKFQIQTQLNYELALCRAFRFLQLFCENNNIQMKKFLMKQTNQDGSQKITSINFIMEACYLLRQFFKIMSSKVVNIPPSLLDFINQITQIPCLDCQKSLMRSTFFQDISYMAGFFESKQNIQQRKFSFFIDNNPKHEDDENNALPQQEDPLSTLMQIYQKGVGLALSNFEGNDNEIFWEFLNKCQAKFLWIAIRQNLVKLLRPNAARYGIKRQQVEKQVQKQYLQYSDSKEEKSKEEKIKEEKIRQEKRLIYQQYREFIVEYTFIRKIFACFNDREIHRFIGQQKAKGETYPQQIINIINALAILKKIDDYAQKRQKAAISNPQMIDLQQSAKALKARNFRKQLWSYAQDDHYPHIESFTDMFEELILSIEISSDNGQIVGFQNLYFPNHPVFSYLAADTRDTIMFQVSRDTQRDKLTTLFDFYGELKEEIQSNYKLKYYSIQVGSFKFPISITSEFIQQIRKVARYISYIICFLMLWFIVVDHDTIEQASYFNFFHSHEKLLMRVLRIIQLMLTLLFFTLWIKMRYSLCMSKLRAEEQEGGGQNEENVQEEQQEQEVEMPVPTQIIPKILYYTIRLQRIFFKTTSSFTFVINHIKDALIKFAGLPGIRHIGAVIFFFLNPIYQFIKTILIGFKTLNQYQSGFLAILIFVIAAIMGNFVGAQWYVIHLFDYFVGISLLTNVFKAVIDNIGQLSLLSAFAGCFILVFNIISLNTYTPVIFEDDLPAQACENVIDCVLTVYTSGAIGDDMDDLYGGRFTFDTIYFIFMQILFSNLVSGIMIDGFGGLKEADFEREQDKKNKCYICSMQKPDIEKTGTTFKKHTEKHFLWNYLFYRYVVEMKDPSDYTGLQYTISTQIQEKKVQWFPDNGPKQQSGQIQTLMSSIKERITKIADEVKGLLDKNADQVKNSTRAIQVGVEKIAAIKIAQNAAIQEVVGAE